MLFDTYFSVYHASAITPLAPQEKGLVLFISASPVPPHIADSQTDIWQIILLYFKMILIHLKL